VKHTIIPNSWFVIVCPVAGRGKAVQWANALKNWCDDETITLELVNTHFRGHATQLARDAAINGHRNFLAIGGDGTASEVIEGLVTQTSIPTDEFIVTTLPAGTGNDWARTLNIPKSHHRAFQILKRGHTACHDVGKVEYHLDGQTRTRHFVNMAGIGLDAFILQQLGDHRPGPWAYYLELFKAAAIYSAPTLSISTVNGTVEMPALMFIASLGKYGGGGMKIATDAVVDDGLFNMKFVSAMGGWKILAESRHLLWGTLGNSRYTQEFTASNVQIDSHDEVLLQADGELLGTTPVSITILPKAIRVLMLP
jgi:diacylglycerol kinase (ATP)